jgi:uncharacterized protein YndB with AHSA1/START domain
MTDPVRRELDLEATIDEAWQALTDPRWLAAWLADEVELDCRPGGEARFDVDGEVRRGWIEEVVPPDGEGPARLTFWWARDAEPASRVELELTPISEEQTRLRVVEDRPLEVLDLVGIPLPGTPGHRYGPALVAA